MHKVEDDQQFFNQNHDSPQRIKKFHNYYLDDQDKNQQKKNWMSAERAQNNHDTSNMVADPNLTFISSVHSPTPNDDGIKADSFTLM